MSEDTFPSGLPRVRPRDESHQVRAVVVTGMSGAGKTKAAAALQDAGWYVVDNLPPHMLHELLTTMEGSGVSKVAAVIDVRGGQYFADLDAALTDLDQAGLDVDVMYLDASDDALVARFEEARRPHPLQTTTIVDAVRQERERLATVRDRAAMVLDTSATNVHQLRDMVLDAVDHVDSPLKVTVESFGFKHGVPKDADFVADVRFLDNPHWIEELRPQTGLDAPVRDHVLGSEGAAPFVDAYAAMLGEVIPRYRPRDRQNLTVAIGCTGGRHRSVAIAEELAARLRGQGVDVQTVHRDRGGVS